MACGRLFDAFVMVDWSAAGRARLGANSIWVASGGPGGDEILLDNLPTRRAALHRLGALLADLRTTGKRVLLGFDFPFGYPAGTAERVAGRAGWRPLWDWIAGRLQDGPDNGNNRYELAEAINAAAFDGAGPFWGHPHQRRYLHLPMRKPDGYGIRYPAERREVERRAPRAQVVWKLVGNGQAGGQVLTGLPVVRALRDDPRFAGEVAVWPFEAGEKPAALPPVLLAEIYPSLESLPSGPEVKDARQVRAVVERLARADASGELAAMVSAPWSLPPALRPAVVEEEGWILNLPAEATELRGERPESRRRPAYLKDPSAIYARSFELLRAVADWSGVPPTLRPLAERLVHAAGEPALLAELRASTDLPEKAVQALRDGAPVLADCAMVEAGITRRFLPRGNEVLCLLDDARVPEVAERLGTTRSAAAVELWRDRLRGAVVAIGNAPTALFHLLEGLDRGWPKPAAILGFPVGFVGAAEAKQALADDPVGVPFATLLGRRGGSALAAAAVNALALEACR